MSLDLKMQRLFDRAQLIDGIGDPRLDRFCIMSFVAFMAGEWFGDRPKTASPIIRKLLIPLNDRLDAQTRQRLKPLAPRIIGTNDGHDDVRAALIYETIVAKVIPAVIAGVPRRGDERTNTAAGNGDAPVPFDLDALPSPLRRHLDHIIAAHASGRFDVLAKEAGHLLATLAETAPDTHSRTWYHTVALDLIDRLCDVGPRLREQSARAPRPSEVTSAR